ncbi:MAG: NADH-quinone oxidoreductase subunit M [Chthoniobacterales bacterium]|nr:NADH-quinone oxidoreductase subunit M [Chthoniobacterales bacterium]
MLLFIVFVPIAVALLILAGAPARASAVAASGAVLLATLLAFAGFDGGHAGYQLVTSRLVSADWGIHLAFGIDGLSLIMLLLTSLVTFAAVWFTPSIPEHENAFYACLLLMAGGALGAFASIDLFFFYAFHELALIPTFLLIGIWGTGNRQTAAWKITIYLATGSFILLIGLLLLYRSLPEAARSFDFRLLQKTAGQIPAGMQHHIYLLLLIGFGILISLFPFHTWAPQAYASAPAPAAMLHAGVLKKFGLYGLLRIAIPLLPEGARYWTGLLLVLLLGNIIYVGLVTIAQKRLDWMLGYSSVMHMGYIFLGIAAGNIVGANGAALLMLAHGLSIAVLFAVAGEIRGRTGTLVFSDLGGLAKVMPFAGLVFGLATFAAIGLPGFANFSAEVMVFFGAFHVGADLQHFHAFQVTTVLALWGVVISAVYMLRAYRTIFMGSASEASASATDIGTNLRPPIFLLVGAMLWVGFFPQSLVGRMQGSWRTSFPGK